MPYNSLIYSVQFGGFLYIQSCAIITTILEHSHFPKKNPPLLSFQGLIFPSLHPNTHTHSPKQPLTYFVSLDLPILGISDKQNQMLRGPL